MRAKKNLLWSCLCLIYDKKFHINPPDIHHNHSSGNLAIRPSAKFLFRVILISIFLRIQPIFRDWVIFLGMEGKLENHNTQKFTGQSDSLLKWLMYVRSIFTPQNFRWTHNAYQEVKSVEKAYIFGTTKNTLDKKK